MEQQPPSYATSTSSLSCLHQNSLPQWPLAHFQDMCRPLCLSFLLRVGCTTDVCLIKPEWVKGLLFGAEGKVCVEWFRSGVPGASFAVRLKGGASRGLALWHCMSRLTIPGRPRHLNLDLVLQVILKIYLKEDQMPLI